MNCFCTIITPNYIYYSLALRDSLVQFNNETRLYILISGNDNNLKQKIEIEYDNTFVILMDTLIKTGTGRAIYDKYFHTDIHDFRWSMKPVLINYLLTELGMKKVLYCDSDIHFFSSYDFLFNELDTSDILITPHWRSSNPHFDEANFQILLTSGLYNGGFIGANENATAAMQWWAMACEYMCVKDPARGLFGDQAYLNLLPIYFDNVKIIKHKGCNVANWNMVESKRTNSADKKTVVIADKYPIVFIHFTSSTIRGIISGEDNLLRPFLVRYNESLKKYNPQIDILPTHNLIAEKEPDPLMNKTMYRKLKKIIKTSFKGTRVK